MFDVICGGRRRGGRGRGRGRDGGECEAFSLVFLHQFVVHNRTVIASHSSSTHLDILTPSLGPFFIYSFQL